MSARQTNRERIAAVLTATTLFAAVHDHETKDLAGLSPVAMVHSDGTAPITERGSAQRHGYIISLWVKRTDAASAEDEIDSLSADVLAALRSAQATLPTLYYPPNQFSEMDYPIVEVMYRRERIRVIV